MRKRMIRAWPFAGALSAASFAALVALTGCERLPEPVRKLVEPAPQTHPDEPVRVTLRDRMLTLGCVRSSSGTCHFLVISHAPDRIEAFKVAQGQGRDVERVGSAAFYCMDPQRTPDIDKCERKKLWAALEPAPEK